MPTWPPELQQVPIREGYSDQDEPNLIESPTETGPGKTRPRQSHASATVSAAVVVTKEQKRILRLFHRNELGFGSIPFDWPDMDEVVDDGETHAYRMTKPPRFASFGVQWKASFDLKVW